MAKPQAISPRLGSRRQPAASRDAILRAALAEFAQEGLAGARMDAIATAAGVNKALLYYYFQDKDTLYGAVLDRFFVGLTERVMDELNGPAPVGERLLRYTSTHFNCVAESPHYAKLFQGELMSAGRGGSPHLTRIVQQYIRPIAMRLTAVLHEGMDKGEFREVDPFQVAPSIAAINVHYFVIAPVAQKLLNRDPYSPEAIRQRRAAVLDFVAAALFADRDAGLKLAARIAEEESERHELETAPKPGRGRTQGKSK